MSMNPNNFDIRSAIDVANHKGKTKRQKHTYVRIHHLQPHIRNSNVVLRHNSGNYNPADAITKQLPTPEFTKYRSIIITTPPK